MGYHDHGKAFLCQLAQQRGLADRHRRALHPQALTDRAVSRTRNEVILFRITVANHPDRRRCRLIRNAHIKHNALA